jgi:hypothetical protein
LEVAPLIRALTQFTDILDSLQECHFHFLNEQKQALGGFKNTKRGKKKITCFSEVSK